MRDVNRRARHHVDGVMPFPSRSRVASAQSRARGHGYRRRIRMASMCVRGGPRPARRDAMTS